MIASVVRRVLRIVGDFEVGEMIGEGGMGRVFRARHCRSKRLAAIKIVGDSAGLAGANWELRSEVQAHASLVHPNIVYLLDYGEVLWDSDIAQPYVVMEFADRGTLRTNAPANWPALHKVILDVLKALAFAHARGVIHRDLKPENLLLFQNGDVKLADFGIARTFGWKRDLHSRQVVAGTPQYMAPEQITGHWRESGPWTDIYALGCLVWEMVCGRPPFHGQNVMADVLLPHLHHERPSLDACMDVPPKLDAWLKQAMAIHPNQRFQSAAHAIHELPRTEDLLPSATPYDLLEAPTAQWFASTTPVELPTLDFDLDSTLPSVAEYAHWPSPDFPKDWRQDEVLLDSELQGIGLFGIREPPFVGRERERDLLWNSLNRALSEGQTLAIHVEGEEGSGKSRLVNWLGERALELGLADVFRASHSANTSPGNGLIGMVIRYLNAWEEDRESLADRLQRRVPKRSNGEDADFSALLDLIYPKESSVKSYWDNLENRIRLLGRVIYRLAQSRPTIFILDDVHFSVETTKWLGHFVRMYPNLPFLLLMTSVSRHGDLDIRTELDSCGQLESTKKLELSPLSTQDHLKLVSKLLPMSHRLAQTIAERSEGHPQFAVQILADLIEKDALRSTDESGHDLRKTFEIALPTTVQQVWLERLERLTQAYPNSEEVWQTIEFAATLGRDITNAEWAALIPNDPARAATLRDDLVARGLAIRRPEGLTFAHRLLVESILAKSNAEGRLKTNHARCAKLLEDLPYFPGCDGRVADHWIEATEYERAWEPLDKECTRLRRAANASEVRRVLARQIWLADLIELSDTSPKRLGVKIFQEYYELMFSHDAKAAQVPLEDLLKQCLETNDWHCIVRASVALSDCYLMLGDLEKALRVSAQGLKAAEQSQAPDMLASAHDTYGWILHMSGRNLEAKAHLERSLHFKDNDYLKMASSVVLSYVLLALGDYSKATTLLETTIVLAEEAGFRVLVGDVFNTLGEVARFSSDIESASAHYKKSIEIRREMGRPVSLVEFNLELLQCLNGETESALSFLRENKNLFDSHQVLERMIVLLAHGVNQRWAEFEGELDGVVEALHRSSRLERDYPWLLSLCCDSARRANKVSIVERLTQMVEALEVRIRS